MTGGDVAVHADQLHAREARSDSTVEPDPAALKDLVGGSAGRSGFSRPRGTAGGVFFPRPGKTARHLRM